MFVHKQGQKIVHYLFCLPHPYLLYHNMSLTEFIEYVFNRNLTNIIILRIFNMTLGYGSNLITFRKNVTG